MDASKMKIVYVITERNNKSFWTRIGVAFVNNDGSLNVKLEAVPVSGELQIRDYVARDDNAFRNERSDSERMGNGHADTDAYAEIA